MEQKAQPRYTVGKRKKTKQNMVYELEQWIGFDKVITVLGSI